jgi:Kdo2-lipid IVA lauroyltransferase/acyltransferase
LFLNKKIMVSRCITYAGIFLIRLVSYLPLTVLYLISDCMYFMVFYIFRYRRSVVLENLTNSFPDKSLQELQTVSCSYYRYLCDLVVETIKTRAFSADDISAKMKIRNPEVLNAFFNQGKSIIIMSMHYGNWEWLLHMPLLIRYHHFFVYKPLQNEIFDRFFNEGRERFGGETVSMSLALKKLLESDKKGIPVLTWRAADQTPPWNHPFWTMFLHQKTKFFNGPAKLARRFDQPVFFQQVKKIKRGYYETWFTLLCEDPKEVPEESITLAYVREAEKVIRETPENYLWSHRRWKNKKHAPEKIFANLPV